METLKLDVEETLNILTPKIKKELYQTNLDNRDDLEQELYLMIITTVKNKSFKKPLSFKKLLEQENII